MTGPNLTEIRDVCERVARAAGDMIAKAAKEAKKVESKDTAIDLVTETDQAVEKYVAEELSSAYPDAKFIGEESAAAGVKQELTDVLTFICDPVDGTTNFVHAFPHCAVSIAVAYESRPVIGIVYNPLRDEMFSAIEGQGASLNNNPIKTSGETKLAKSLVITEWGSRRQPQYMEPLVANMTAMAKASQGMRCMGSAALNCCEVAAARADVFYEYGIHCWDYAAGAVIAKEAGCHVCDPDGSAVDIMARRVMVSSTKSNAEEVSKLLSPMIFERD
eukprot:Clim_evm30s229 gene=Clim_evmTU30s229